MTFLQTSTWGGDTAQETHKRELPLNFAAWVPSSKRKGGTEITHTQACHRDSNPSLALVASLSKPQHCLGCKRLISGEQTEPVWVSPPFPPQSSVATYVTPGGRLAVNDLLIGSAKQGGRKRAEGELRSLQETGSG